MPGGRITPRSHAGDFSKARWERAARLHLKETKGDGYHRRRTSQVQQLVLRLVVMVAASSSATTVELK